MMTGFIVRGMVVVPVVIQQMLGVLLEQWVVGRGTGRCLCFLNDCGNREEEGQRNLTGERWVDIGRDGRVTFYTYALALA